MKSKPTQSVVYCPANGKVAYDKRSAITAKNARWEQAHVELRAYQCEVCDGWHLTKQLRRNEHDLYTQFHKSKRDKQTKTRKRWSPVWDSRSRDRMR